MLHAEGKEWTQEPRNVEAHQRIIREGRAMTMSQKERTESEREAVGGGVIMAAKRMHDEREQVSAGEGGRKTHATNTFILKSKESQTNHVIIASIFPCGLSLCA